MFEFSRDDRCQFVTTAPTFGYEISPKGKPKEPQPGDPADREPNAGDGDREPKAGDGDREPKSSEPGDREPKSSEPGDRDPKSSEPGDPTIGLNIGCNILAILLHPGFCLCGSFLG